MPRLPGPTPFRERPLPVHHAGGVGPLCTRPGLGALPCRPLLRWPPPAQTTWPALDPGGPAPARGSLPRSPPPPGPPRRPRPTSRHVDVLPTAPRPLGAPGRFSLLGRLGPTGVPHSPGARCTEPGAASGPTRGCVMPGRPHEPVLAPPTPSGPRPALEARPAPARGRGLHTGRGARREMDSTSLVPFSFWSTVTHDAPGRPLPPQAQGEDPAGPRGPCPPAPPHLAERPGCPASCGGRNSGDGATEKRQSHTVSDKDTGDQPSLCSGESEGAWGTQWAADGQPTHAPAWQACSSLCSRSAHVTSVCPRDECGQNESSATRTKYLRREKRLL